MSEMLPISRAARAAGVSRKALQEKIVAGELESFEGMVWMDRLFEVFPPARFKESAQITRMREIKEAAVHKAVADDSPSEFHRLRMKIAGLEEELSDSRQLADAYRGIIDSMAIRLEDIQANCDQRQKLMLETLLSWMLHKVQKSTER